MLWTCEEIGIAYTRADDGPELARNPNGLVPVIVDGDFVLWESNSIIRYLANKWAAQRVAARASRSRARRSTGGSTGRRRSSTMRGVMLFRPSSAAIRPSMTAGEIEASKKAWTRMLAILDAQLARTGAHVAGERFTLADIPIGLSVNRWFMTPLERPAFAAVAAYYERLSGRPAFLKHGRNGIA